MSHRKVYFNHEKLNVYQFSLKYISWVNTLSERLKGPNRHARDQLYRASQSIPLNIAEGNGKTSDGDRKRYFEIARTSALECAAIQDVLEVSNAISEDENESGKKILNSIVAMLTKLSKRSYCISDESAVYGIDSD